MLCVLIEISAFVWDVSSNQMIPRNFIVTANAKVVGSCIRQSWSQVNFYRECTPQYIMKSNYDLRVHLKINRHYKSRNRGCYKTYDLKSRRPLNYKPNIWQLQKNTSDKLSCSYLFPSQYRVIEFDKYSWINPSFADHLRVQKSAREAEDQGKVWDCVCEKNVYVFGHCPSGLFRTNGNRQCKLIFK